MKEVKKLVLLFKDLFPEESFLSGLSDLSLDVFEKEKTTSFSDQFYEHLLFYKENLYPLPFERMYKAGNIIFYHLQKEKALDNYFLNGMDDLLKFDKGSSFYLNEGMARKFLKLVFSSYIEFDKRRKEALAKSMREVRCKKTKKSFQNPVKDFESWQQNLCGLEILDKQIVLNEAKKIKNEIKNEAKDKDVCPDPKSLINFLLDYFQDISGEDMSDVEVVKTPEYLKPIIPIAAAYTFDRLRSNPRHVVFVSPTKDVSAAKIMLVLFHEVFGHILHFKLVNKHCKSDLKKLPYLSRFPLTEGFALLGEDCLLKIMAKEKTQRDIEKHLGKDFSGKRTFLGIRNFHYKSRLLRYLRYIFELEVYLEHKPPMKAIKELSETFQFDSDSLEEDLLSFLITPGYASCYIGGYKILKKLGDYEDPGFRKSLGEQGFDFIMNL